MCCRPATLTPLVCRPVVLLGCRVVGSVVLSAAGVGAGVRGPPQRRSLAAVCGVWWARYLAAGAISPPGQVFEPFPPFSPVTAGVFRYALLRAGVFFSGCGLCAQARSTRRCARAAYVAPGGMQCERGGVCPPQRLARGLPARRAPVFGPACPAPARVVSAGGRCPFRSLCRGPRGGYEGGAVSRILARHFSRCPLLAEVAVGGTAAGVRRGGWVRPPPARAGRRPPCAPCASVSCCGEGRPASRARPLWTAVDAPNPPAGFRAPGEDATPLAGSCRLLRAWAGGGGGGGEWRAVGGGGGASGRGGDGRACSRWGQGLWGWAGGEGGGGGVSAGVWGVWGGRWAGAGGCGAGCCGGAGGAGGRRYGCRLRPLAGGAAGGGGVAGSPASRLHPGKGREAAEVPGCPVPSFPPPPLPARASPGLAVGGAGTSARTYGYSL